MGKADIEAKIRIGQAAGPVPIQIYAKSEISVQFCPFVAEMYADIKRGFSETATDLIAVLNEYVVVIGNRSKGRYLEWKDTVGARIKVRAWAEDGQVCRRRQENRALRAEMRV